MATTSRNSGFAGPVSKAELETMKDLIALWVNSDVEGKQRSVVKHKKYRIDQQKNNGFDKEIIDGDHKCMKRYQLLAVQRDNDVFAEVLLPIGEKIGEGLIRKALYESLENGKLVTLLPAPKVHGAKDKYILTLAVGILLLPLLL